MMAELNSTGEPQCNVKHRRKRSLAPPRANLPVSRSIAEHFIAGNRRAGSIVRHVDTFTKEGYRPVRIQKIASTRMVATVVARRMLAAVKTGMAVVIGNRFKLRVVLDVLSVVEKSFRYGSLIHRFNRATIDASPHQYLGKGRAVWLANYPANSGSGNVSIRVRFQVGRRAIRSGGRSSTDFPFWVGTGIACSNSLARTIGNLPDRDAGGHIEQALLRLG